MSRNLGLTYAGVTSVLILMISVSGWCWGTQNSTGLTNIRLRDTCLAIWGLSGVLLALSRVAFLAIGVQMKHYVVLAFAGCVLLIIGGFVFLLSIMPS
jgi:hypothetical protein